MYQQKALYITAKKGDWKIEERSIQKPGKGEVLVKILSTALNPVDWKIQKNGYFVENFPAIIGSDSSGEVIEVGEGVTNFKVGDRVVHQGWFLDNDYATFQQFALCPAEILAKIPDSFSFDEAATLPLGLATAVVGLFNPVEERGIGLTPFWTPEGKDKYKDQPIVVLGGSSSVGQFAIQVAKLSGFNPIITTSSLKHGDFLKTLGATHVIDRNSDNITAQIKPLLPNGLSNVVYDAISLKDTEAIAVELTPPDGKILLTLPDVVDFGKRTKVNTFGNVHAQRKVGVGLYSVLPELLQNGSIKPNRFEVLGGLSAIPEGLERMAEDKISGIKLIAHPWE